MLSLSKHASCLVPALVLAACSNQPEGMPPGDRIPCAVDGAAQFALVCTLERGPAGFVVHEPDGGFRRFTGSGAAIALADGSERASMVQVEDQLELTVGEDRYRIPATEASDSAMQ